MTSQDYNKIKEVVKAIVARIEMEADDCDRYYPQDEKTFKAMIDEALTTAFIFHGDNFVWNVANCIRIHSIEDARCRTYYNLANARLIQNNNSYSIHGAVSDFAKYALYYMAFDILEGVKI